MTANPEPEPQGSPWFQQLVREGEIGPGVTLEYLTSFELFESDDEADEFLEWLYRFRRTGVA